MYVPTIENSQCQHQLIFREVADSNLVPETGSHDIEGLEFHISDVCWDSNSVVACTVIHFSVYIAGYFNIKYVSD